MVHFMRRSLLFQLLSVYLLFVLIVLIGGVVVDALVEQQLRNDAQVTDQALAQEIALQTSVQLHDAEDSLIALGKLVVQAHTPDEITRDFRTFQAARNTVDHVYWLDPLGGITVAWPPVEVMAEFSPPTVVQQARIAMHPVFEVGIVEIATQTPVNPGVIIAAPMRSSSGNLIGIVAASLSLQELSDPLTSVVQAQQHQERTLLISIIDDQGRLVATPDHIRMLQTVLDELPGADVALQGHTASRLAPGPDGQNWLFSAVPVLDTGWAVVVQRPESEALAVVTQFHIWLLAAVMLFAIGGLLFWLMLLVRVIRPLHTLAIQHQVLPTSEQAIPINATILAKRNDEVGGLARSLVRLERDGLEKLGELQTLLETSNAVVTSLEPYAVVKKIIREVRRLVDVQAAAVLLPDEQGILHVMVSDGHSEHYNHELALFPENTNSSAVQALQAGKPVQKILGLSQPPSLSYDEGFNTVLAIPIISRHAGGVVLLVHRTEAHLFNQNEIDLLLTFANYATLAWEHAVLYERSKTTLLTAVGHELRTPLTAIKGYASTLLQEDVSWSLADQRHFLETISSEADRLAQLVSNLLDLSRQEAGFLLLNRKPAALQRLITKTIERLHRPDITLEMHIPESLPFVDVDQARIEVVLHNLIINAFAYGNGEIHISTKRQKDEIIVSVSDNGPGIAADELPHVFERFYRAQHGRQQRSGGTGLGLTICKAFIEAHGCTIWAESGKKGTTISFSLPLATSTPDAQAHTFLRQEQKLA